MQHACHIVHFGLIRLNCRKRFSFLDKHLSIGFGGCIIRFHKVTQVENERVNYPHWWCSSVDYLGYNGIVQAIMTWEGGPAAENNCLPLSQCRQRAVFFAVTFSFRFWDYVERGKFKVAEIGPSFVTMFRRECVHYTWHVIKIAFSKISR